MKIQEIYESESPTRLDELFDNARPTTVRSQTGDQTIIDFVTSGGQKGILVFYHEPTNKDDIQNFLSRYSDIRQIENAHAVLPNMFKKLKKRKYSQLSISFSIGDSTNVTGKGEALEIFATVVAEIRKFVAKNSPDTIDFTGDSESRQKLYHRMTKVIGSGYKTHTQGKNFLMIKSKFATELESWINTNK